MRFTLIQVFVCLGLSGLGNFITIADDDVCEHPVDHNLFELGREVNMTISATQDEEYGYLKIEFGDDAGVYAGTTATGWCVDLGRSIGTGTYQVDSYSSYDNVSIPSGAVDRPENLDLINWFVNKYYIGKTVSPPSNGCPSTELTWREIQKAIWTIIDNGSIPGTSAVQCVVDYMVDDTFLNGEEFEPCCADNEKMAAVLVVDNDATGEITNQVIVAEMLLQNVNNACPEYNGGGGKDRVTTAPTPDPTLSITPGQTPSITPDPTKVDTPAPTSSSTPGQTPSITPAPTSSSTPGQTPSITPDPTKLDTPAPTLSSTSAPTPRETAGAVGDPHFKTWTGEMYDFHGVCDLVLLKNPGFRNGLGMEIHIRTKKTLQWSYISNVAIVIGDYESFEVMGAGKQTRYWINGVEGDKLHGKDNMDLPDGIISGFNIHYKQLHSQQKEFVIDLKNGGEKIVIATWKNKMIRVEIVDGTEQNFGGSLGLMGTFGRESKKLARDNSTVIENAMAFGQEWQVLPSEEKLFHNTEGPQAPSHCDIPSKSTLRRRLGQSTVDKEAAEMACAKVKSTAEFNICVFDVMVSSDVDTAGAY